jgi:sulfite exporter TauE/SafE
MGALTTTVFGISLLGSLHCAGMCGPLAAFAGGLGNLERTSRTLLQVSYHGGRMLMYVLLGAVAGGLGAGLNHGTGLVGIQRGAAVAAGGVMILIGLAALLSCAGIRVGRPRGVRRWSRVLTDMLERGHRLARRLTPVPRALVIGLLTAFLPCGWLYAFVLAAAATGEVWRGGLLMLAFWAGSVPILVLVGLGATSLLRRLGPRAALLSSVALVGLGCFMIVERAALSPERLMTRLQAAPLGTVEDLSRLDSGTMPCCDGDE